MKTIFIFGSLSEQLARPLPLDLKTFKFLPCSGNCTDFDESHKPLQAMYNHRQGRNIYANFHQLHMIAAYISSVILALTLKTARKQSSRKDGCGEVTNFFINTNTGSAYRLVSPVRAKRYDKRPIADEQTSLTSLWRGKGWLLSSLFSSTALSLAGHQNSNQTYNPK